MTSLYERLGGLDATEAHESMGVTAVEFDALVEDLVVTLEECGARIRRSCFFRAELHDDSRVPPVERILAR